MEKKNVSEKIRIYLGTPKVIHTIQTIGAKLSIPDPGLLPRIVFDFVSGTIAPQALKDTIKKEIKLRDKKIDTIVFELKEKIFSPIKNELADAGINIENIDTTGALSLQEFIKKENEFLKSIGAEPEFEENELSIEEEDSEYKPISLEVIAPHADVEIKTEPIKITIDETKQTTDSAPAPFILHREKPILDTTHFPKKDTNATTSKGFSFSFGFFKSKQTQTPNIPIQAQIEIPNISQKEEKIVHYSDLRTPVIPFQKEKSFINSEKPSAPIDILQKKELEKVDLQSIQKPQQMQAQHASILSLSSFTRKNGNDSITLPKEKINQEISHEEKTPQKKEPAATFTSSQLAPQDKKPKVTGTGFFWNFKKKEDIQPQKTQEKGGASLEGNQIDLRQ